MEPAASVVTRLRPSPPSPSADTSGSTTSTGPPVVFPRRIPGVCESTHTTAATPVRGSAEGRALAPEIRSSSAHGPDLPDLRRSSQPASLLVEAVGGRDVPTAPAHVATTSPRKVIPPSPPKTVPSPFGKRPQPLFLCDPNGAHVLSPSSAAEAGKGSLSESLSPSPPHPTHPVPEPVPPLSKSCASLPEPRQRASTLSKESSQRFPPPSLLAIPNPTALAHTPSCPQLRTLTDSPESQSPSRPRGRCGFVGGRAAEPMVDDMHVQSPFPPEPCGTFTLAEFVGPSSSNTSSATYAQQVQQSDPPEDATALPPVAEQPAEEEPDAPAEALDPVRLRGDGLSCGRVLAPLTDVRVPSAARAVTSIVAPVLRGRAQLADQDQMRHAHAPVPALVSNAGDHVGDVHRASISLTATPSSDDSGVQQSRLVAATSERKGRDEPDGTDGLDEIHMEDNVPGRSAELLMPHVSPTLEIKSAEPTLLLPPRHPVPRRVSPALTRTASRQSYSSNFPSTGSLRSPPPAVVPSAYQHMPSAPTVRLAIVEADKTSSSIAQSPLLGPSSTSDDRTAVTPNFDANFQAVWIRMSSLPGHHFRGGPKDTDADLTPLGPQPSLPPPAQTSTSASSLHDICPFDGLLEQSSSVHPSIRIEREAHRPGRAASQTEMLWDSGNTANRSEVTETIIRITGTDGDGDGSEHVTNDNEENDDNDDEAQYMADTVSSTQWRFMADHGELLDTSSLTDTLDPFSNPAGHPASLPRPLVVSGSPPLQLKSPRARLHSLPHNTSQRPSLLNLSQMQTYTSRAGERAKKALLADAARNQANSLSASPRVRCLGDLMSTEALNDAHSAASPARGGSWSALYNDVVSLDGVGAAFSPLRHQRLSNSALRNSNRDAAHGDPLSRPSWFDTMPRAPSFSAAVQDDGIDCEGPLQKQQTDVYVPNGRRKPHRRISLFDSDNSAGQHHALQGSEKPSTGLAKTGIVPPRCLVPVVMAFGASSCTSTARQSYSEGMPSRTMGFGGRGADLLASQDDLENDNTHVSALPTKWRHMHFETDDDGSIQVFSNGPASPLGGTALPVSGTLQHDDHRQWTGAVPEAAVPFNGSQLSIPPEGSLLSPRPLAVITQTGTVETSSDGCLMINQNVLWQELGSGSMGVVFLGVHAATGDPRAVKVIDRCTITPAHVRGVSEDHLPRRSSGLNKGVVPPVLQSAGSALRLNRGSSLTVLNEARVMRQLRHRSIVPLYECIDDPALDAVYLVMRFIPHGPIAKVDAASGRCVALPNCPQEFGRAPIEVEPLSAPLALQDVISTTRQLLEAVAFMHAKGFVHGDIKPDNVLVEVLADSCDVPVKIYLADFGVAQTATAETDDPPVASSVPSVMPVKLQAPVLPASLQNSPFGAAMVSPMSETESGSTGRNTQRIMEGNLAFAAPELFTGGMTSKASDMWACGMLLYALLAGRLPFHGTTLAALCDAVCESDLPPIGGKTAKTDAFLDKILRPLLAKKPQFRATSAECLEALGCLEARRLV